MKAIILAAGPGKSTSPISSTAAAQNDSPWVLQRLGDRPLIDYVLELARHVVAAEDVIIVGDVHGGAIEEYVRASGFPYQYVAQEEPRGTGDAVLRARPALADYAGDILILHGDRPFFRRSSVLGVIQRHELKEACLTLISGLSRHALDAGRILRTHSGQIVDIMEGTLRNGAGLHSTETKQEFNMGAYVVQSGVLWPTLDRIALEHQQADLLPFTACIRSMIHAGCRVEGYRLLDDDELQSINTSADLEQAAIILQKRQLRPRRIEEHNIIRFGTGGWRALIGEGFTLDNVRRLCQAIAFDVIRIGRENQGVIIGFDRRFLADSAAQIAAEVFAGNGIRTELLTEPVPTPLVTYATAEHGFYYGLMFTASHNPPEWNGLKVFAGDGSLPLDEQIARIEREANELSPDEVVKVDLETALAGGIVSHADYTNAYVDAVEALIDLEIIRAAGLRVAADPMHGVGQNALEIVLTEARCRVNTIHAQHDPLFGGRSPAPDAGSLGLLIATVVEGKYDLGLAMDGDADRIAIIDRHGDFITTNELLVLLYYYLHEVRNERGGVTRNIATTHLLDRLAAHFGEEAYEVPVGFKHIGASMKAHDVLLAGESSGGLSIRGHLLGKDGIFACALVVEMIARTGRGIVEMLDEIYEITGRMESRELNVAATPAMKVLVPRRLEEAAPATIAGLAVERISTEDGTKFYLEGGSWLLLRFSGTEPLLRIFAEAETDAQVDALVAWARALVG